MSPPRHAVKYPRTPHLPWSPGFESGDDMADDYASCFGGRVVVVTEKLDGENVSLYRDGLHARSMDSRHHPSRDWLKAAHAGFAWKIPEGWRVCGESLYARHSIAYEALESYLYLFSVWTDENVCLSWDETVLWAEELGVALPRVLHRGAWDEAAVRGIALDTARQEGYVVRLEDGFHYDDFKRSVAKWVRPDHVQTADIHWALAPVIPNGLRRREAEPGA